MFPFAVLGLTEDATHDEIEARYAALKPTWTGARLEMLEAAYAELKDPRRAAYTRWMWGGLVHPKPSDDRPPLHEALQVWAEGEPRRRLTAEQVAALVRGD